MVIEIQSIGCCPAAIRLKKLILEVLLEELYFEIRDTLIYNPCPDSRQLCLTMRESTPVSIRANGKAVGLVLRDCDQHGFPSVDTLKFLLDGDEIGLLMVTERNGSCKGTAVGFDLLNILQLTSPSCYLGDSVDCKSKLTACPFMETK
ncbi:hypothetical protein WN943_011416 [Citrus x changshan-huyou]